MLQHPLRSEAASIHFVGNGSQRATNHGSSAAKESRGVPPHSLVLVSLPDGQCSVPSQSVHRSAQASGSMIGRRHSRLRHARNTSHRWRVRVIPPLQKLGKCSTVKEVWGARVTVSKSARRWNHDSVGPGLICEEQRCDSPYLSTATQLLVARASPHEPRSAGMRTMRLDGMWRATHSCSCLRLTAEVATSHGPYTPRSRRHVRDTGVAHSFGELSEFYRSGLPRRPVS